MSNSSSSLLPLLVCLGSVVLYTHSDHWNADLNKKGCDSWRCLLFTLQWPGSFCVTIRNTSECQVPSSIQNWTIHGLWPVRTQLCCDCWHFSNSDVQELEEELAKFWPSLLKTKTSFQFWTQEWQRHGVCAALCVHGLSSPLLYFQISLKLRASFDIHRALDEAAIKPSCDHSYQLDEIHNALSPVLGESIQIQCVQDNKGREVWVQVKIPLSKNLTLGCQHIQERDPVADFAQKASTSAGHRCPDESPVYYFPIDHDRPHQPCD